MTIKTNSCMLSTIPGQYLFFNLPLLVGLDVSIWIFICVHNDSDSWLAAAK